MVEKYKVKEKFCFWDLVSLFLDNLFLENWFGVLVKILMLIVGLYINY